MQRKGNRFIAEVETWLGTAYLSCWVEDKTSGERDNGLPLKGPRQLRAGLYQLRGQPIDKNTASLNLEPG